MQNLIERYEIGVNLNEYINLHALIIDMQANPIIIFNDSLHFLYANPALKSLLKSSEPDISVEKLNAHFRGVQQVISNSLEECKSRTLNKVVKDAGTNQLIPYEIKILPIVHEQSCVGVFMIVETDIHRLVNYFEEEKLELSKKVSELTQKHKNTIMLVNALFDNSPVGMMTLDNHRRIVQVNKSGRNILGIQGKNVTGMRVDRFYNEPTINEKTDKPLPKELIVRTWDEVEKIILHCSVESIDDEQKMFTVETFLDVTSIENARVAAEHSNQAKSEFLANISHELRTPLHTIMGFSECGLELDSVEKLGKAKSYFTKIHHGGEVLLALVDELLDIAQLETGKIDFHLEDAHFDKLVEEVIKEFDVIAENKGIELRFDVLNPIQAMQLDASRIQQVVRNLVSNAIKFTAKNTRIFVILEQFNDYIQLRVSDHGPGVPEDELETIFNKFIQSSRTKTGAGGTGLGLSICREILSQHNGEIWVENNPDGGAVFIVNLYLNKN